MSHAKLAGSVNYQSSDLINFDSVLKVFAQDVTLGRCLSKYRRAFIVYMFRRPSDVWSLVSNNASISGAGKARIDRSQNRDNLF